MINQIIDDARANGPSSYYAFEAFVLNLLKHHIELQGKIFEATSDERFALADGLAREGFDDFIGITAIEVKLSISRQSWRSILERTHRYLATTPNPAAIKNLVVVCGRAIPTGVKKLLLAEAAAENFPFNIFIWGVDDLNKISNKHKAKANEISKNLFSLRLASAAEKTAIDWREERDRIKSQLKDCYQKGQFTLFLGAGVSSSAGMPDWNTLLNSLFVTYLTKEFNDDKSASDEAISQLVGRLGAVDEPSALMAARYLRKGLTKSSKEAEDFNAEITRNLYKLRNKSFDLDSRLIKSIVEMCMPRRTGAKVKSVITYNFDDLLERQLEKNRILCRCIYSDTETYDPDELPVYHVHGFLPEDRKKYDRLDKSTLVFSEEGYHRIYSDSYHWSNLVQLNSLRENNCLMVGLSMADPNLRRLLDLSAKNIERSKHYAFMKRLTRENFCFERKDGMSEPVVNDLPLADKFLDGHHTLNEQLMKELGVSVIWYENYDEIPQFIEEVVRQ